MALLALATANYSLLTHATATGRNLTVGVLLEDPVESLVHIRLRRDWWALHEDGTLDIEDIEVLEILEDDLRAKSQEFGAARFFRWLEDSLSNTLRVTDREAVIVDTITRSVDRLYRQHVAPKVLPFRTHLPVFTLQAAAGRLLENQQVEAEGWEETPSDLRLTDDLFIAHINGRSMEPKIPDGSLCVFRYNVAGSRNGRLVLVENLREGGNDRYTVKRYRSEKTKAVDDPENPSWSHGRIRLEPLNPEFEAWDINPADGQVRVIAEFIRVLPT